MRPFHSVLMVATVLLAGCGTSGPPMAVVQGTVTFDGQPLEKGLIQFLPDSKQSVPTVSLEIIKGEFKGKTYVGLAGVAFTSPMVVGQRKAYATEDSPLIDEVTERIPRHNSRAAEVKPGVNKFDFALTTANNKVGP